MKLDSTDALAIQGLKILHHAELQIGNALPEMISAASDPDLKSLFERALAHSREHLNGLERLLGEMGEQPIGERCETMEGLLADIDLLIAEGCEPQVLDLALIGAKQQVGHFQMASYNSAMTLALAAGPGRGSAVARPMPGARKGSRRGLGRFIKTERQSARRSNRIVRRGHQYCRRQRTHYVRIQERARKTPSVRLYERRAK